MAYPQGYSNPPLYNQDTRGYEERPPIAQRQNHHGFEYMQRPQNSSYAQHRNAEYDGGRAYPEESGYNANRTHRTPPGQFPTGDYNKPIKRPPRQPPQPGPINTGHRTYQNVPAAPRSAGPYQEASRYYVRDEPYAPRQLQGRRGESNGTADARYEEYAENSGYDAYDQADNHHTPGVNGENGQPFRPSNGYGIQQHHRGHSDGSYQYSEKAVQGVRRDHGQQRPSNERPNARQNGGLEMQKRRVFEDPISPETVSWDNPFPTFPAAKKKAGQPENGLEDAMANMNLRGGAGGTGEWRPQTAPNRDNVDNSRSVGGVGAPSSRGGLPPNGEPHFSRNDVNFDHSIQRQEAYDYHQSSYEEQRPRQHDTGLNDTKPPLGVGLESRKLHQDLIRPEPPVGRRSDEPPRGSVSQHNGTFELDSGRSRTMPSAVSSSIMDPQAQRGYTQSTAFQNPKRIPGNFGPSNDAYQPERPSTATRSRPAGPHQTRSGEISRLRSDQARSPLGNGRPNAQQKAVRPPVVHQDSIADLYDSYYNTSSRKESHNVRGEDHTYQQPVQDDMPNFEALPHTNPGHQRGMTIDNHIPPPLQSPEMPPMPAPRRQGDPAAFGPGTSSQRMLHSKSQPDLRNRPPPRTQQDNGFDFGIPEIYPHTSHNASQSPSNYAEHRQDYEQRQGAVINSHRQPPAPYRSNHEAQPNDPNLHSGRGASPYTPSPQQNLNQAPSERYRADIDARPVNPYGRGLPDHPQSERYRSPNGQDRTLSNRPSPAAGAGPTSPPPMKPDTLPAHPPPVRAGLMQSASPNQVPKPAPVRNYNNNASPLQESIMMQPPPPLQQSDAQSIAPKLTSNDVEGLRRVAKSNPTDQKAQMNLAKGLVQAASALEEYVPQTDQKSRIKTRERYITEAHKTIKRLVSTGYPDAMFFLGDCYSQGRLGLDKDAKEAFSLYQGAAKAGHAQAAFRVAVCCELGLEEDGGTKRDLGKAVQWYKRAATLGDTPAMYKTGVIQLKGLLGQPKDPGEAVAWLRKAAEKADKDNPHALHELALWHEAASGNGKIVGDEAYAKQLFVQAAELGYKFSQYRLGRACEYGLMGCPIDPRLSISWYSKAAVQEEHQSELALSGWYLTGAEGVLQQSDTEAYLWARKAATAGLAKAEFAMGYFTEVGIGCPPSSEEAKRWYWRAACKS